MAIVSGVRGMQKLGKILSMLDEGMKGINVKFNTDKNTCDVVDIKTKANVIVNL